MLQKHFFRFAMACTLLCGSRLMGAEFGPGGVPLPSDPDLYAWYVGEDGIGADGIADTPFWSNRQGELGRDIYPSFSASGGTAVRIDNAHNGNDALEYVDRVSWRGAIDPRPPAPSEPTGDGWGTLDVSLAGATVFAVANFPQADKAFLFQGNNGGA